MNKKTRAKKAALKNKKRKRAGLSAIFITVAILGFIAAVLLSRYINSGAVIENNKTEVKKLPPEIKKQIEHTTPTAIFRVPVLMYHYVEYVKDKRDTIRQSLDVVPATFDEQLKTLKDAGYTFMTAKDLGEVLDGKKQLPA